MFEYTFMVMSGFDIMLILSVIVHYALDNFLEVGKLHFEEGRQHSLFNITKNSFIFFHLACYLSTCACL